MTTIPETMEGTASSAITLAISRLTDEIEALPPFSEKRELLAAERSKLFDIRRKLEAIA